jgi:hypothetical protein
MPEEDLISYVHDKYRLTLMQFLSQDPEKVKEIEAEYRRYKNGVTEPSAEERFQTQAKVINNRERTPLHHEKKRAGRISNL